MTATLRRLARPTFLALASAMMATPHVAAQAPAGVGGSWLVEYYRPDGSLGGTGAELARARMRLSVSRDSLQGTWQDLEPDGSARGQTRPLTGTSRDGRIAIASAPVQAVMRHGLMERRISLVFSYDFIQRGDSLVGTHTSRSSDGRTVNTPRPFTATREHP